MKNGKAHRRSSNTKAANESRSVHAAEVSVAEGLTEDTSRVEGGCHSQGVESSDPVDDEHN